MKIENVESRFVGMYTESYVVVISTSEGEKKFSRCSRKEGPLEVCAKKYIGKDAPPLLAKFVRKIGERREGLTKLFLPKAVARPPRGETSITGLFETHWKSVPLDLAVFEDRWEISLREEKEYQSGYYRYSRIFVTSVLEARDRETGKIGIVQEIITPDGNGPNRFDCHLGNRVLAIRICSDGIWVKTRFGRHTKTHFVSLRPLDS